MRRIFRLWLLLTLALSGSAFPQRGTLRFSDLPDVAQSRILDALSQDMPWLQLAELTASDGTSNDQFGFSAAVSGTTVVVGAPYASVGNNQAQGAAYIFVKPESGWENMTQVAKLTASDGKALDLFGGQSRSAETRYWSGFLAITRAVGVIFSFGQRMAGRTRPRPPS